LRLSYAGPGQSLPGFSDLFRAPWPVRKGSANISKGKIKPPPAMTRQEAARFYQRLEEFERETRRPGRQDGAIGRNGLAVARALIYGFLNWKTGRLDPSHQEIAKRANIAPRSVARGLDALRRAGVVEWVRRCVETTDEAGRFCLAQISNLYAFRAVARWIGFQSKAPAATPDASTPDAIALGLAPVIERGTVDAGTFDREYELIELEAMAAGRCVLSAVLARGLRNRASANDSTGLPDRPSNPTIIYN